MRLFSIVLVAAGAALGYYGHYISQSLTSQVSQFLNGTPSDKALYFYLAGVLSALAGAFLLFRRR